MSTTVPTQCEICSAQPQKYNCPRCNILYCSLACYKAESHAQCSETFYKDCVVQEMAMLSKQVPAGLVDSGSDASQAEVRRMYEILKRMEESGGGAADEDAYGEEDDGEELDSDDEEMDAELADRLKDIDLNDANAVWDRLTDAERQEFEKIVQSEDVSTLMVFKEPWWTHLETKPLIEDITEGVKKQKKTSRSDIPPIYQRIVPFEKLSSKPPAACVRHNLTNVLAAYALTYRYFNGDHVLNAAEACSFLLNVSANLRLNQNFDEQTLAVQAVQTSDASETERELNATDVQAILAGVDGQSNGYTLAALSDVHRMLSTARKGTVALVAASGSDAAAAAKSGEFTKRFQDQEVVDAELVSRSKLSACLKKIEYYLAYVNQFK